MPFLKDDWRGEKYSSAVLSSFICCLGDEGWEILDDRMMVTTSPSDLALASRRIVRAVSQLLFLSIRLPAGHRSMRPGGWSRPERESANSQENGLEKCSWRQQLNAFPGHRLHKHYEITEASLAHMFSSCDFQPAVKCLLGGVVKQLNQSLCAVAVARKGAGVICDALKGLGLAGEVLADVSDQATALDVREFSATAAVEVVAVITDCVRDCHQRRRESIRVLRDLATRLAERKSRTDWTDTEGKSDAEIKSSLPQISFETIHKDLAPCRGVCTQILKGLLGKYLTLFCPESFSLMTGPLKFNLPTLESVATDLLNMVFGIVTEICRRNECIAFPLRLLMKTKLREVVDDVSVMRLEFSLQEKLQSFLTHHKEAVEEEKRREWEQLKQIVSAILSENEDRMAEEARGPEAGANDRVHIVRAMVDQMQVICAGRSNLNSKLQAVTSKERLPSLSWLLRSPKSLPSCRHTSRSERLHCFVEAAVKHLLLSLFQPPPSWGMGRATRVQCSRAAAFKFAQTTPQYDSIISTYVRLMCHQVMHGRRRISDAFRLQLQIESFLDFLGEEKDADKK